MLMNLSERKKEILKVIIEAYVETAEPVGSKTVAAGLDSSVSSATIRNEMASLESLGLLEQPHTSAGRIPSSLGYRIYVNELMREYRLSRGDAQEINRALGSSAARQEHLLDEAGNLASRLTRYPAYALAAATGVVSVARFDFIYVDSFTFIIVALLNNDTVKNRLIHLLSPIHNEQLIKLATVFNASFAGVAEERITPALITSTERALSDTAGLVAVVAGFTIEMLYDAKAGQARVTGTMSLLDHPEYRDIDKAQRLMRYLTDDKELARLPSPETAGDIKITIGPENLADELHDTTVMTVRYDAGDDMQGLIGVVGPVRMDYSKVAAKLLYIARGLSRVLIGELPSMIGFDTNTDLDTAIKTDINANINTDNNNTELGDDDIGQE